MISPYDSQYARSQVLDVTLSSEAQVDASTAQEHSFARRLFELKGEPTPRNKRSLAARTMVWLIWLYVLGVAGTWLALRYGGDRWWFATLMLFGPRWIYGLPLVLLLPLAIAVRRRLLWPLGFSVVILVGPIMGCCVPWSTFVRSDEPVIRVLTWNVQNDFVNSEKLAALINNSKPDIVALQECHTDLQLVWPAGWHVHRQGRLVTGSLHPISAIQVSKRRWPPSKWPPDNALRCVIQTPNHRIGFINVHLRTPRQGLQEVLSRRTFIDLSKRSSVMNEIEYRRLECEELVGWIGEFSEPVVIAGDFNMPTDSSIYRQSWSKYSNAFSAAGVGFGHTKSTAVLAWQYRSRIDHILTGPGWRPCGCWVGPNLGSDHLPLIADLGWDGP